MFSGVGKKFIRELQKVVNIPNKIPAGICKRFFSLNAFLKSKICAITRIT
jgi:hypothetical protein